jgi:pilus assembly protein CpaF
VTASAAEVAHRSVIAMAARGAEIDEALVTRSVRESAPLLGDGAHADAITDVLAAAAGLGPLDVLLRDEAVTDVMVNGNGSVWVERDGVVSTTGIVLTAVQTLRLIERVVAPLGLKIDRRSASVDARLSDGSRVHAIVPPLAVDGPCLTIRRFALRPLPVEAFTSRVVARLLESAVRQGANVLVSGGTGSGKTTLLNALAAAIPASERVVTIEDTAELRLSHPHVVRLETRPASPEGVGACTARQLVREALRMRPDRIVVGECRGGEALDMVMAMNTGHAGSMSTCHANDEGAALRRLATLCLFAESGVPLDAAINEVHAAIDLVVHVARSGGARSVTSISAVRNGCVQQVVAGDAVVDEEGARRWA